MALSGFAFAEEDSLPDSDLDVVFPEYETPRLETSIEIHIDELRRTHTDEFVRVLVFPHIGKYTTPQKGETVIDEVTLRSDGGCRTSVGGGNFEASSSRMTFHFSELALPVLVNCEKPVQVIREAGLKSYTYEGRFEVRAARSSDGRDYVQVVNILPVENYLRGVVAAEMLYTWPMEALKVQAISARTYGLYEIYAARQESPGASYDIDDTILYQAYLGLTGSAARTDEAIRATRRQVMTYHGYLIKAYFSADSGGYTEGAENVWNKGPLPYCVSKEEVYDPSLVKMDWNVNSSLTDIHSRLVESQRASPDISLVSIEVKDSDRTQSRRAGRVTLSFEDGSLLSLRGEDFRHLMRFRSMLYTFSTDQDGKVHFQGKGWGHGVGMSQYGTRALVNSLGWNSDQVLKFYFTGIAIETL